MPLIALALLLAAAEPEAKRPPLVVEIGAAPALPPPAVVVDAPVTLVATPASSSTETVIAPWLGVRGGVRGAAVGPLFWGAEAALHLGGTERSGTTAVAVTRAFAALEGRGRLGAAWRTTNVDLGGYGFGGALAGAGLAVLRAFDDGRARPLGTLGLRGGLGVEARVVRGTARLELGLGVRDVRPEVSTSFALGVSF